MTKANTYQVKVNGEWININSRVQAVHVSREFKAINHDGDIRAFTHGVLNESLTSRLNKLTNA